ncbi:sulfite exporter TauE/SafE family protein [Persephonella sp.]
MISFTAVLVGWIVQGLLGIGSGIISTGILLFFYEPKTVVVSLSIIALLGTAYLTAVNYRSKFFLKDVSLLIFFSFIGVGIGSFFLEELDHRKIELIFGIIVFLTGIYDFYAQKKKIFLQGKHKTVMGVLTGISGGIVSGLTGGAGPLYALYLNQTIHNKTDFKFVLSLVFTALNIERVFFYTLSPQLLQLFDPDILLPGIVAVFIGAYIGHRLTGKLSTQRFKESISVSITLFGIYFIYRSITG